jgi:hypothetical protein
MMNRAICLFCLAGFCWWACPSTGQKVDSTPGATKHKGNRDPDLRPPPLRTAIARADNDYAYEEPYEDEGSKHVPLPNSVREKVCGVLPEQFLSTSNETVKPKKYAEIFGPVFRVTIPGDKHRHLYVCKLYTMMAGYDFILVVHDVRTDEVTAQPARFSGWWMRGCLLAVPFKKPLVDFDDLNLDAKPEVVFQERVHNGTELNAIIYHYLQVEKDLSLVPIFDLETRTYHDLFYTEDGRSGYVIRTIEKVKPNRITVRVTLSADPFKEGKMKLGFVELERQDASSPFEEKKQVVHVKEYEQFLLHHPLYREGQY